MTITRKALIIAGIIIAAWLLFGRTGSDSPLHRCIEEQKMIDQQHQISNGQPTPFQRCQSQLSPGQSHAR